MRSPESGSSLESGRALSSALDLFELLLLGAGDGLRLLLGLPARGPRKKSTALAGGVLVALVPRIFFGLL